MPIPDWIPFFIKALVYPAVFGLFAWRWKHIVRFAAWRFVWAGLVRYGLGWLLIPVGLFVFGAVPEPGGLVLFLIIRLAVWMAVAKVFFLRVRAIELFGAAVVGTLVNLGLDLLLYPQGLSDAFNIRIC